MWSPPEICPVQMRTAASPSSAASPAPTPPTAKTCPSTFRMGWRNTCSTTLQKDPPISRHTKQRVGAPPAGRGREDHRPPIGLRSGWGHRGDDVRGTLDWALSRLWWEREVDLQLFRKQILCSAGLALRTITAKTTAWVPTDAHWGCTTGAFSC